MSIYLCDKTRWQTEVSHSFGWTLSWLGGYPGVEKYICSFLMVCVPGVCV